MGPDLGSLAGTNQTSEHKTSKGNNFELVQLSKLFCSARSKQNFIKSFKVKDLKDHSRHKILLLFFR
jgi:hypothetical protein